MWATYPNSFIYRKSEIQMQGHTARIRPDHSETSPILGATICSSRVRASLFESDRVNCDDMRRSGVAQR